MGICVLIVTLFKRWRLGSSFSYIKPRLVQPVILADRKWGNHSFVKLEVRIKF